MATRREEESFEQPTTLGTQTNMVHSLTLTLRERELPVTRAIMFVENRSLLPVGEG